MLPEILSFIAQTTPAPTEFPVEWVIFGAVFAALAGIVSLGKNIMDIIKGASGSPPPDRRFASKEEVHEFRKTTALQIRHLGEHVDQEIQEVRQEVEQSETRIMNAIGDVRTQIQDGNREFRSLASQIGELKGEIKSWRAS